MAFTLNRRLAQLIDSNGQLLTGKIPNDYISSDHVADNTITSAMLHTSFTVSTSNLTAIDTDDVSEGSSNLYYTDARVGTYISGNRSFGNITTTGYIAGPASMVIDPAGVGDNTGTVVIAGNLQVDGTTTTINSTTMTVDDLNLTLASGAANAAAANGAGITVDGASATITYDGTNDEWDFNKDINVSSRVLVGEVKASSNQTFTHGTGSTVNFRNNSAASRLFIDSSGNVGIGTNTPNEALEVSGNIQFTTSVSTTSDRPAVTAATLANGEIRAKNGDTGDGGFLRLAAGGGTNTGQVSYIDIQGYSNSSGIGPKSVIIGTQGTDRIIVDSLGSVGIGTTSPKTTLNVAANNSGQGPILTLENTDTSITTGDVIGQIDFYANDGSSNGTGAKVNIKAVAQSSAGTVTELTFGTSPSSSATAIERMRIDASGNVGIGTNNPTEKLHIFNSLQSWNQYANIRMSTESDSYAAEIGFHRGTSDDNDRGLFLSGDGTNQQVKILHGGNVGIGTTAPFSKLSINSNGAPATSTGNMATTGLTIHDGTGGTAVQLGTYNAGSWGYIQSGYVNNATVAREFRIMNGANYTMTLSNTGNVGIGTTAPAYKLDISGTSNDLTPLIRGTATNTPSGGFNWVTEFIAANLANDKRLTHIWGKARTTYGMAHVSYMPKSTASESYLALGLWGANDILNVLGNGNVGIGTTAPLNELQVNGDVHIGNGADYSSYAKLAVYDNVYQGDVGLLIKNDRYNDSSATASLIFEHRTHGQQGHAAKIVCRRQGSYNESAGSKDAALDFYTAEGSTLTRHAYLERGGKFVLENNGGSAYGSYGKGSALRVDELSVSQTGTHYIEISGNLPGYSAGQYNVLATSLNDLHFAAGGTYTGYISYNGGFTDISDEREKENITTITNATEKLKQLRGVYHTWKDTENRGTDTHIGLIAQEVEAVVPEVVTTSNPTSLNTPESDTAGLKGVAYAKLVPLLIETIKELEARITELEG
jgi:hypothetical protein